MTTPTTNNERPMTGPKARFRGKDRQRVLTFALTPAGNAALAARLAATGLSRSDYLEGLIRDDVRRVMERPTQTEDGHADEHHNRATG